MNDLALARQRRQVQVLEDAAEDRELFALYWEILDHQASRGGWPERLHLGGGYHAVMIEAWPTSRSES